MNELDEGALIFMIKNSDGSFSPVSLDKSQACIIRTFLAKLSEDSPLVINRDKYVQAT